MPLINIYATDSYYTCSRSPRGERGLKLVVLHKDFLRGLKNEDWSIKAVGYAGYDEGLARTCRQDHESVALAGLQMLHASVNSLSLVIS